MGRNDDDDDKDGDDDDDDDDDDNKDDDKVGAITTTISYNGRLVGLNVYSSLLLINLFKTAH